MKTRLKRLPIRPRQNARVSSRYKKVNQKMAQSIKVEELLAKNKMKIMETDENGFLVADPSNPSHRSWMED